MEFNYDNDARTFHLSITRPTFGNRQTTHPTQVSGTYLSLISLSCL